MNILICNERFLFRFGADRVLILLGQRLKECGHTVFAMANRYDREVAERAFSRIIHVPTHADAYVHLNEFTAGWLERTWHQHFPDGSRPDLVLVGGWPFFAAIPFFRRIGAKVAFIECGAVPLQGYTGEALVIQKKLRDLRKQYLKDSSVIITNSQFTADSQSVVDTNGEVPIFPVLLGADHMDMTLWSASHSQLEGQEASLAFLRVLQRQGRKTILNLGRWEPGCYKNSEVVFDFIQRILPAFPDCALLILAEPSNVSIPSGLENFIFPVGFPDDHVLAEIMKAVDLGISVSLWEGFNLPLAEMQWLDRPVLAFNLAAHPEVILHPWYLCQDLTELTQKAGEILCGQGLDIEMRTVVLEKFRRYFRWSRVFEEFINIFDDLVQVGSKKNRKVTKEDCLRLTLIVDVSNSTKDPANSGVIRVTRRLSRELQRHANVIFVVWDPTTASYVLPTRAEYQQLAQFNGPVFTPGSLLSSENHREPLSQILEQSRMAVVWLLLTETTIETNAYAIRQFAQKHDLRVAAIFYDAIPVLHPEFCNASIKRDHPPYMRGLADCDVVIPISHFSARCLSDFWTMEQIAGCAVQPNELPGEFGGSERTMQSLLAPPKEVHILCVSTLEPRKNHLRLIRACLFIQERFPDLNWSLTLVGHRYDGAFDLADTIEVIAEKIPRIKWLGVVDDATLHQLYQEASFTVYPSIVEGFGMPILESIWHGRPCICSREGVMGELAAGGGCLTTNVMDEQELSDAIYRMATDEQLLLKLSQEAVSRKIKTWEAYTQELLSILRTQINRRLPNHSNTTQADSSLLVQNIPTWQDILYPACLCENWQMSDSERLAITALLARHRPRCAIEVGTFQGGSLSLLSQFSEMVFSLDIDPSIPEKFQKFQNVSFLTGPSSVILPLLLKELDTAGITPDFILVDGDHSTEGVKKDINCLLSYIPKKPFFVLLHDSFNPGCRKGILEADWTRSLYVEWIDLDFVPGRLVEQEGPFGGELWGGLALAYFTPVPRRRSLQIHRSTERMFTAMNQYSNHIK